MRPVSIHTAAWRYPGGTPDANFNLKALISYAQTLERGKFDAFFMADHLAVLNMPMEALKRSATVTSFDPLTLLPALAQHTQHLGLIATASTTFEPAYTIARRFASLDHISDGRAGWNLVTTSNPDAALNFGMDEQMEHAERYARAREFFDVVTGLWDSWADDAFIRDVESGIYFDPAKLHVLNHKGKYLKVTRAAQHRPADPGLAGDGAGRRLRCRPPARRRDRRGGVRRRRADRGGPRLLCRREGPRGQGRPQSRPPEDPARRLHHHRRFARRGEGEARQARQPGELRQRHRRALDRGRPGRAQVRSRRAIARDPRDQPEQERPRAGDCARQAREPDGAPDRRPPGRLWRARHDGHAQDDRRPDGGVADDRTPPTAST